jgi:hypothetical protein
MKEHSSCDLKHFTLSESAQDFLRKHMSGWIGGASKQGLVPMLWFVGSMRTEKDGKTLWEYQGPLFGLFAEKPERLGTGKYYDLLGAAVWIDKFSSLLLKGRTLTVKKVGSPEPREHLVLDNVPEDYVQTALRESAGCGS